MQSIYGLLAAPLSEYGTNVSTSIASLYVGSPADFNPDSDDTSSVFVLSNGDTVDSPGEFSKVDASTIWFPAEETASITEFHASIDSATAIYKAQVQGGTLYMLFSGDASVFCSNLAKTFSKAYFVNQQTTLALIASCDISVADTISLKDNDHPSRVLVRKIYVSSGPDTSSFSFASDHSIWKDGSSDVTVVDSQHFKSIGSILQGVRGIAEGNGLPRDADKLVKCEADGTIPVGVLPDGLVVTAESIADEAAERAAADTELSNRMSGIESSLSTRVTELETRADGHDTSISGLESRTASLETASAAHGSDISALQGKTDLTNEAVASLRSDLDGASERLSQVSDGLEQLRRDVDTLASTVDGIREDLTEDETKIASLESISTQQSSDLASLAISINTLTQSVASVQNTLYAVDASIKVINSSIEDLDRRVTALENCGS